MAPPRSIEPLAVEVDELVAVGRQAGLVAVGVAPAEVMLRARAALHERKAAGLHADMAFTYKNPDRSTDPRATFPWAESLVVGALRYDGADPEDAPSRWPGRVARYVASDHGDQLAGALDRIAEVLRRHGHRATVVSDQNHLIDREAAYLAGLGWFGKNANLLVPGVGSWVLLGSVVTSAPLPASREVVADGCGSCVRCIEDCPTGAIVAPGVVDAGRCLAWLAQSPGIFPTQWRVALGDRIYGCDDCQEVCPPNRLVLRRHPGRRPDPWVALLEVIEATDAELLARFDRLYLFDREPRWLRRNALIALANVGRPGEADIERVLVAALGHDDPIIRAHAVWAAARLMGPDAVRALADDPDPRVRLEVSAVLP